MNTPDPREKLEPFEALIGDWTMELTHPAVEGGAVIRGHTTYEWLEGERFLIQRAANEHPDFPDSISILGCESPDGAGGAEHDQLLLANACGTLLRSRVLRALRRILLVGFLGHLTVPLRRARADLAGCDAHLSKTRSLRLRAR